MIIDTLANASKYYALHPQFQKAFEYIKNNQLENTADGTLDMPENLRAFITTSQGKTAETSLLKFECHDLNIDIQYCITGKETYGWKPREKCKITNGDYNPDKDVLFFSEAPDLFFELTDGQFVIFYPEDVHAPMIGTGAIKKLVIKVKIAQ